MSVTPIEQEIEKLAEKHLHNWDAEGRLHILDHMLAAMRELIPIIREECAKIADEVADRNKLDCGCGFAIAAAIREGK